MNVKTWILLIAKNIFKGVTLLIGVSIIAFLLVSNSPIDPIQMNVGATAYNNMSPEKKAQLESYWGVDTPQSERYMNWAKDFISGDMGTSLKYNRPVSEVIGNKFFNSMVLMTIAWVFSGILGFILGIVAGVFSGKWPDKLIKGYALILASTPTFWFALLMLMVFSVWLGWFPFGMSVPIGVSSDEVTIFDSIRHLILPAITLSMIGIANITLHTREKMIEIMESDYFIFSKARGESRFEVVKNHGIRNILLPAITLQFAAISEIFGGSVLVEQVFSYPGLGQAAVTAGLGGDMALLLGISVVSAALVFTGNMVANILYGMVDPRIRRGELNG
ncbi:MAG: ABC transporter permease [Eubacteriaceae bacterium]